MDCVAGLPCLVAALASLDKGVEMLRKRRPEVQKAGEEGEELRGRLTSGTGGTLQIMAGLALCDMASMPKDGEN